MQSHEPIFVSKSEAAKLLSVCTRTLDNLEKDGVITPLRHKRLIRYAVSDIHALQSNMRESSGK